MAFKFGAKRRTIEALALTLLVLALWTMPAMVSQGQDRTTETMAALHVDSALLSDSVQAKAALDQADELALSLAHLPRH